MRKDRQIRLARTRQLQKKRSTARPTPLGFVEFLSENFLLLRSFTISFVTIFVIGLFVFALVRDILDDSVRVQSFNVPEPVVELGLSGDVAARRLLDSTRSIYEQASTLKDGLKITASPNQIDFVEPNTKLSVRSISDPIRNILRPNQIEVTGEISCFEEKCSEENLNIRIRIQGNEKSVVLDIGANSTKGTGDIFFLAASRVMEELDPYTLASALFEDDEDGAEKILLELIAEAHSDRMWASLLMGNITFRRAATTDIEIIKERLFHDAEMWFEQSINFAVLDGLPEFSSPLLNLGLVLNQQGKFSQSIQRLTDYTKREPKSAKGWAALGQILARNCDMDGSRDAFLKASRFSPSDPIIWYNWGIAEYVLGNFEGAQKRFESAVLLAPFNRQYWTALGLSLRKTQSSPDYISLGVQGYLMPVGPSQIALSEIDVEKLDSQSHCQ